MTISYLTYEEIDKNKWDACICNAVNRLIYARPFYLDAMAPNWCGIVLGDYEAVMPLTWKRKWGIKYLYQPAFMQQGGIFSSDPLQPPVIDAILSKALSEYKFAEITLNYLNDIGYHVGKFQIKSRDNFIIDLQHGYDNIYENYDPSFTKSLRRIKKFNLNYSSYANHKDIIHLYQELYTHRLPKFLNIDFTNFELVCDQLATENNLISRVILNDSREIISAVILLKDGKRLYNMISCITTEGKKSEANYTLYDQLIHELAGTNLTLDLEGSDVAGIAAFYKKFNPLNEPYPFLKYNNLNPLIKLFKN